SFHRMKLRNNTHFRINFLHNDLANMVLTAKLSLNDLHIVGAYERVITNNNSSDFFYAPTFGEVELLLRNVQYTVEGRYRLSRNKLWIEIIVSDVAISDILTMYINKQKANKTSPFPRENIGRLLDLLKTNLDKWLKDYINDYLTYFTNAGNKASRNFLKYDQEKTIALNEYVDNVLERINEKIELYSITDNYIQSFNITAVNGMVNCAYDAVIHTDRYTKRHGDVVVSADEFIAHMSLTLTKDQETLDLIFDSFQHIIPKFLTISGHFRLLIGNFKHLLKIHVLTYISNLIAERIRMLHGITKCEYTLEGAGPQDERWKTEPKKKKM
ncbi:unnamed protein product, partial [Parnassius apollo]